MFAATMGMTVSDINTLAAVTQRDIIPAVSSRFRRFVETPSRSLTMARITTASFTALTILVGLSADSFGGVLSLVVSWFGAMVGITGVPLLLGLFKGLGSANGAVAITSVLTGFAAFAVTKTVPTFPVDLAVATPLIVSAVVFIGGALILRARGSEPDAEAGALLDALGSDAGDQPETVQAAQVRGPLPECPGRRTPSHCARPPGIGNTVGSIVGDALDPRRQP